MGSPTAPLDGAWRQAGLVVVAGLATGVLTQLGQGILPEGWSQAANAISPWLLVAFLVGSTMSTCLVRRSPGSACSLLALVGYDLAILVQYGYGPSLGPRVLWGTGAIVGGLVFGTAGRWWRAGRIGSAPWGSGCSSRSSSRRGSTTRSSSRTRPSGAGFVIVGLLVPLILGRSRDDRIGAYVAAPPSSPSAVSSATWPSPG